jgi:hypothetical protein
VDARHKAGHDGRNTDSAESENCQVSRFRSFDEMGLGVGDFQGGKTALDRSEDIVCRLGPPEGLAIIIDGFDVVPNGFFQLAG